MRLLRTNLTTDFQQEKKSGFIQSVLHRLDSNPDDLPRLVREWFVEFDTNGLPYWEIGQGDNGRPVLAGPDDCNYGFWFDTNMRYDDLIGAVVRPGVFEVLWVEWYEQAESRDTS